MICASQKASTIARLIPLLSRRMFNCEITSTCQGFVKAQQCAFQPLLFNERLVSGCLVVPRRSFASGSKEDYILHQNTLTEPEKKEIEDSVKKDFEDWVPYGFSATDKEEDIFSYKMFMFNGLTLLAVVLVYLIHHMPRRELARDWITREAYLELERRQRLGLPLVDKNLIPEDKILLPSLEELGDDYDLII